jgi:sRNA-binding protein
MPTKRVEEVQAEKEEATPEKKPAKKRRAAAKPSAKPAVMRYRAKKFPINHPYQRVTVPVAHAVPLEVDNWVEIQVKAGVIEEV